MRKCPGRSGAAVGLLVDRAARASPGAPRPRPHRPAAGRRGPSRCAREGSSAARRSASDDARREVPEDEHAGEEQAAEHRQDRQAVPVNPERQGNGARVRRGPRSRKSPAGEHNVITSRPAWRKKQQRRPAAARAGPDLAAGVASAVLCVVLAGTALAVDTARGGGVRLAQAARRSARDRSRRRVPPAPGPSSRARARLAPRDPAAAARRDDPGGMRARARRGSAAARLAPPGHRARHAADDRDPRPAPAARRLARRSPRARAALTAVFLGAAALNAAVAVLESARDLQPVSAGNLRRAAGDGSLRRQRRLPGDHARARVRASRSASCVERAGRARRGFSRAWRSPLFAARAGRQPEPDGAHRGPRRRRRPARPALSQSAPSCRSAPRPWPRSPVAVAGLPSPRSPGAGARDGRARTATGTRSSRFAGGPWASAVEMTRERPLLGIRSGDVRRPSTSRTGSPPRSGRSGVSSARSSRARTPRRTATICRCSSDAGIPAAILAVGAAGCLFAAIARRRLAPTRSPRRSSSRPCSRPERRPP